MAEERKHRVKEILSWAKDIHWLWTLFPAGWKAAIVALLIGAVGGLLALMRRTTAAHWYLFFLAAIGIYIICWAVVRRRSDKLPDQIEAEICHIAISPRSIAYSLVRDAFRIAGHPENASTDCDVLVKLYVVNNSSAKRFIRDFLASVCIGSTEITLERQDDLHAEEFDGRSFDYGLRLEDGGDVVEMPYLYKSLPLGLDPQEPIDGWLRFVAKDILPESIDNKTWKLAIQDSIGKIHPITRISTVQHKGEIAIRSIRS